MGPIVIYYLVITIGGEYNWTRNEWTNSSTRGI